MNTIETISKQEISAEILSQIRQWLKDGATIRATDPTKPVLEMQPDGTCNGGMTVEYPK